MTDLNQNQTVAPVVAPVAPVAPKTPAKKAVAKKTAAKPAPAKTARKAIGPELVITLVATENPKTRTARARFAAYTTGMTVAQYTAATKKLGATSAMALRDVAWDAKQGYIKLALPKAK